MTQNMSDKNFTYTLKDIQQNFKKIPAGSYSDKEFEISLEIMQEATQEIKFSVLISKCPKGIPFWAVLYIQVKDQETKFFINNEKEGKKIQKSFETPFTSDIFTDDTTITYKIKQIQSYICQLSNDGCLCYLNCAVQLLFHLSKFRSLLDIVSSHKESNWIYNLYELFQEMCLSKSCLSTEELTESFGWPTIARRIPHDASEFIQIILERIRSNNDFGKNWREKVDRIFSSQIVTKAKDSQSEDQIESRYIFDLPSVEENTFEQTLEDVLNDTKFLYFPEVLFISPNGLNVEKLPRKLDLSKIGYNQNMHHSKYSLSGIILRKQTPSGICHFTSFVRASSEEIWLYFSDTVKIVYSWKYKRNLKKYLFPLDNEIPDKLKQGQIRLLMYIADDVIDDYFTYSYVIPRKLHDDTQKNDFDGPSRKIMITSTDDIKKYVESGHTDFEEVESSLNFIISADLPYSAVYEKVANEFNVPVDSFILRTETKTKSPSFHEFPNKKSQLKNIRRYSIHLYYEEVTEKRQFLSQYIPFYFLLFKFNSKSYLHNITSNLTRPSADNLLKSTPIRQVKKGRIQRIASTYYRNNEDPDEKKEKANKKNQEKNCFHFLTSLVLRTNSNFNSILDQLIEIINSKDTQKKHSKVTLFTAEYTNDDKEKIGYKEIDTNKTIKENLPQILNGTYIYVQCDDDFLEEDNSSAFQRTIQPKFLFFKYMNQIYKNQIYPKKIPYVFMMENYGVPITFCKLTDPKNKLKTMLFPIKIQIKNIEELKKIICAAMGEKYPENGLMQLFFGFRSEIWPPFHDQIVGEKNIKSVTTILNCSLQNSVGTTTTLNLSAESSGIKLLDKIDRNKKIETDTDYSSNVFIHYHIFDQFTTGQEISVRVYFSEDSISIDHISQVKVPIDSKVSYVIDRLREIFDNKLDEQDVQNLIKIENKEIEFTDVFRVIQTSNGKISRELKLNFSLNSSMEIRVERIPNNYDKNEIECYIPVYYGARYNPTSEVECQTLYVGSVGTPFYFPVLKSDFNDQYFTKEGRFEYSKLYQRLKSMTTEKEFDLFVVNYFGMIQNVKSNDVKTIYGNNLNYCICIHDLNASYFIDEVKFFTDGIRIIR